MTDPATYDKRAIFGWCMYDWANSAYILTVITAVLPVYFSGVVVPPEGFRIGDAWYSATALWGFAISLSALVVFICAPVLGAIADVSSSKKKFMMAFCYGGALSSILLFYCSAGDVWMTMVLIVVSQIGFVGGNIFYDAFLPHIAPKEKMDWVSGKGYAYGYIGSDIQFLLSLAIMTLHDRIGLSKEESVRLVLAFSGLWWGGFSIFTWVWLKERPSSDPTPPLMDALTAGVKRTWYTARKVGQLRHLLLFLVAFMLYNEGIQTVIVMATIYGKDELGLSTDILMVTLLIIQIVAMAGALIFGKLAESWGTRKTILSCLGLWSAIVMYAYFLSGPVEYVALGVVVGIVLGGSQSLSRSYYGSMIPAKASAEFYGFYSVFTKFSAIWGPLIFGLIRHWTGSARLSIVSLVVFFVASSVFLWFVNEDRARETRDLSFDPARS